MTGFEIVAHRGIALEAPENTLASFERALELGADGIEFDVRLTADRVPVVFHDYYLDGKTDGHGPIFAQTLDSLRRVRVLCKSNPAAPPDGIPTLAEVLERFTGRISMEIEIKGPEAEAPELIGAVLEKHRKDWPSMEVISFVPALLLAAKRVCPGIAVDFLLPLTEPWMKPDVVIYQAVHFTRLAGARGVHLHTTQLIPEVAGAIRSSGLGVHAWDVNDLEALEKIAALGIPRICTDQVRLAQEFRGRAG